MEPGYREWAPPAALRDAVTCLWVRVPADGPRPPVRVRVLPDGCTDLIWERGRGAFVAGPDTAAVLTPPGGDLLVGVRLRPGAGGGALGRPLTDLLDRRVPLADLERTALDDPDLPPAAALRELLAETARRVGTAPPDPAVRRAAVLLADPATRVAELAGDLGLSERQLLRRCRAGVGYGPKTLARVIRFQRFLALADRVPDLADLAARAARAGYADQAHLTRDCTRLAGLPPAALLADRRSDLT